MNFVDVKSVIDFDKCEIEIEQVRVINQGGGAARTPGLVGHCQESIPASGKIGGGAARTPRPVAATRAETHGQVQGGGAARTPGSSRCECA